MKYISEKITDYIVKSGAISEESYAIYQYGFQIGIEMLSSFLACFVISIYLHMISEFIVSTIVFMLLRTYAGGIHLNRFLNCFICSICVQTIILLINAQYTFACFISWFIICSGSLFLVKVAPVESISRELDQDEKKNCKRSTIKVLIGIIIFSAVCTFYRINNILSLIALTILVVLISQYMGIAKYKMEKKRRR